jgi:hypothetical protein
MSRAKCKVYRTELILGLRSCLISDMEKTKILETRFGYTDKKKKSNFPHMACEAVAKSYIRKGFL